MVNHFGALFQHDGLAAVFVLLLLENFGFPLPGEAALLYAGYQLGAQGIWGWPELIIVASAACILGETVGYALGRYFERWTRRGLRAA